jgi:hypothetical protein
MAYQPRRYVRVPKGYLEVSDISCGCSARELWALLWQSPSTRRIPGVLRAGPKALAEEFGVGASRVRRALQELITHQLIAYDERTRTMRMRGAIEADPPANAKVLAAWALDLSELPPSPVRAEILDVITASIDAPEQLAHWQQLTAGLSVQRRETNTDTVAHTVSETVSDTPSHTPDPAVPVVPGTRAPQPPPSTVNLDAEALEPYLITADRLGEPFGFAAAAARLSPGHLSRLLEIPIAEWVATLEGLATSFFCGERAKCPPTIIAIITRPKLRQELREGLHEEPGRVLRCALCGTSHSFSVDCPPVCERCREMHAPGAYCRVEAGEAAHAAFLREGRS